MASPVSVARGSAAATAPPLPTGAGTEAPPDAAGRRRESSRTAADLFIATILSSEVADRLLGGFPQGEDGLALGEHPLEGERLAGLPVARGGLLEERGGLPGPRLGEAHRGLELQEMGLDQQ